MIPYSRDQRQVPVPGQIPSQGHPPSVPPPRLPHLHLHSQQHHPHSHPPSAPDTAAAEYYQLAPLTPSYPVTATAYGTYSQGTIPNPNLNLPTYPPSNPFPPTYHRPQLYHPTHSSPPAYTDRYGSVRYAQHTPSQASSSTEGQMSGSASTTPYSNATSLGSRRRGSVSEVGGMDEDTIEHNSLAGPSTQAQPPILPQTATPDPRMMRYMYQNSPYGWQAHPPQQSQQSQQAQQVQPSRQIPQAPAPLAASPDFPLPTGLHSRRSTISRSTDEEYQMEGPSTNMTEEGSRPNSPLKRTTIPTAGLIAKLEEEEDEVETEAEKLDHRKRKRNRTIRSCVPCHNHKRKCDRKRPCGRCTALGLTGTCVYEVDEARDMNDPDVADTERLRKRIAELEQVVRDLRQKAPRSVPSIGTPLQTPMSTPNADSDDKGQDSKKRRVIVDRFARFKIDEAAMAAVASAAAATREANGNSIGSESTDTEGTPDESGKKDYKGEPYGTYLLPGEEMVSDRSGQRTFLGASAGKSMLRRLQEITATKGGGGSEQDLLSIPEDAAFTGVLPDTRKTFPFTTIWSHENFSSEIIPLLPNKEQSEVLLQSWKEEVATFFSAWHVPTLESDFRRFFALSPVEKKNVPLQSLSLFLMLCSLGCVMRASLSEIFGPGNKARDSKDLTSSRLQSELYLSGAFQALRLCSFMSNPSIHTIQAQICINIYLVCSERAADAWAQTGSIVRQCIAMGLHVDPVSLDPKISMRDAEVKRRIWWSVAGIDAYSCLSFGRPSVINFYKTNLPQDRTDDNLSDIPGSAQVQLPPSNVLNNETTDMTYHSAYFQLTIPTYELLDKLFRVDRRYSRSAIYGWFAPAPKLDVQVLEDESHTYDGAIRLAEDIFEWYSHIPRGMRFESEEDTAEKLLYEHSKTRINQILALVMKTFMIVMVLHRPYLRVDPSAYPESTDICAKAAHVILTAYRVGAAVKASILWSWWTMSFRAFHCGAVCAFLAIRQPGTDLAKKCMEDLRGAVHILTDRSIGWRAAHPAQGDLCNGLVTLEKLATAAIQQRATPNRDATKLSVHWTPTYDPSVPLPFSAMDLNADGYLPLNTPLSQIRGFPDTTSPVAPSSSSSGEMSKAPWVDPSPIIMPTSFQLPEGMSTIGDGFNGPESMALPHLWASMFGIKMDGDMN